MWSMKYLFVKPVYYCITALISVQKMHTAILNTSQIFVSRQLKPQK